MGDSWSFTKALSVTSITSSAACSPGAPPPPVLCHYPAWHHNNTMDFFLVVLASQAVGCDHYCRNTATSTNMCCTNVVVPAILSYYCGLYSSLQLCSEECYISKVCITTITGWIFKQFVKLRVLCFFLCSSIQEERYQSSHKDNPWSGA